MHSEPSAIFSLVLFHPTHNKVTYIIVLCLKRSGERRKKPCVFIRPSEIYFTFIIHEIHVSISAVFICQYPLLRIFFFRTHAHSFKIILCYGICMGDVGWLFAVKIHPHFNRTNSRVASALSLRPFTLPHSLWQKWSPLQLILYLPTDTQPPMLYFWLPFGLHVFFALATPSVVCVEK